MAEFVRRSLVVIGLVTAAWVLWRISYALLLAFGGVLFAVFLRGLTDRLAHWTGLGTRAALVVVAISLVALLGLATALIGPSVVSRFDELSDTVIRGIGEVRNFLLDTRWGQRLIDSFSQGASQGGELLGAASRVLFSTLDAVLALVLVIVAGFYLAASPRLYTEGTVRLLPRPQHERMREVLRATGHALWQWLIGQFIIMAVVAVLTAIGLMLIGVPLALPLGLIAGLLEFIPFLGPFLASVPIVLVALTAGPEIALYAIVVLIVIQQVESNVLAPLIQRWAVALPPVLILISTIAITLLFGVLGAIFAAPLMVVVMVWTKMLYMHDVLGERVHVEGAD